MDLWNQSWSLKEKILHWDSSYTGCEFPSHVPSLNNPVDVLSTKCFARKEFSKYLDLDLISEAIQDQFDAKLEHKLVQDFQVLKFYGGYSYQRHFPEDRLVGGKGFGSRRFEKFPSTGRGKVVFDKLEESKVKRLQVYLKYLYPTGQEVNLFK